VKIKLESLQHQLDALRAINDNFYGVDASNNSSSAGDLFSNPLLVNRYNDDANIDIKMETGTGKTYVYTRMMYELHQKYGLFKFVIAVPSPSIKEGTRSFIDSDYARQHFSEFYENTKIELNVINSGDFRSQSGRRNFPVQLSEFVESTRQNINQIEVLLVNAGMLHSKSMSRDDYDQTLLGGETSPIKAIAATRPVVIIDEPHRFPRGKKFYEDIEAMKPQRIVRFGATFPEVVSGRGQNRLIKSDYYRGEPQFDLNAVESFNQGLVKGIDVDYPDMTDKQASNLYKVKSVRAKELVLTEKGNDHTVGVGENLAAVDEDFSGNITYDGGPQHELSNGLSLSKDMKLIPGTFSESYQDEIISEALDRHFDAEQKNFMRTGSEENSPKIKTLTLFFIDSISSFRGEGKGKGWLAEHFEKLLSSKLNALIKVFENPKGKRESEYREFLKATLRSLKSRHQDVYAGYFSEDRGSSDKDVEAEVDDILRNKEKLLSFRDENGSWITRRFLFSKWTLREGWDNPNVFVIAKLRTSGSEISKIQEVGRGLRLPVDETGHRVGQNEWASRLSFLVGYDEQEFAEKLVGEINDDTNVKISTTMLTDSMIDALIKNTMRGGKKLTSADLVNDLGSRGVIDFSHRFTNEAVVNGVKMPGYDAFVHLYPEATQNVQLASGHVRDVKKNKENIRIRLVKPNWNQLRNLWLQLSHRQMVVYDEDVNKKAEIIAKKLFKNKDLFVYKRPQIIHKEIKMAERASLAETSYDYISKYVTMSYGTFLKQLTTGTGLPVNLLNNLMVEAMDKYLHGDTNLINDDTLQNLIKEFNRQFSSVIIEHYHYEKLTFGASTSIFDFQKNDFVDSVPANILGVYSSDAIDDPKYLYERPPLRFDSTNPELQLLKRTYGNEVKVFGKLPKQAIKIPRYDFGTTTPDFIFVIKRKSGDIVYLVVETKADNMRLGDKEIHLIQEKYFNTLKEKGVYYQMATSEEEVEQKIRWLGETEK